jgi:hypothetical protein
MSQVKSNLQGLPPLGVVAKTRDIVTKMTGNANFTTPVPALPALTTGATDLETAYNAAIAARSASKAATNTLAVKLAALHALLMQEASYVQTTSGGDATKIDSSGFGVRNEPAPAVKLPAPLSLVLNANVNPGTMALKWKNVRGAVSYVVERAPDSAEPHQFAGVAIPTSPRCTVSGMTSGARYWFRVAAVNAAGNGLYSAEQSKFAP